MFTKRNRIIAIFLCIMLCMFLTACDYRQNLRNKINKVKPEVDYGFTSYTAGYLIKDNVYYDFDEMTKKLLIKERSFHSSDHSYNHKLIDNYAYFYYKYDSHGGIKRDRDNKSYNNYTFDVALVKVNITDITCEIVYKFENVYPTNNYEYGDPHFSFVVDKNRAVVQYNGYIQILDLNNKVITDSIEVYDKEAYRVDPYKNNFYFNSYGDYYVKNGDSLRYYELDGYNFKLHEYKINPDSSHVSRYKNYVYTRNYTNKANYFECYDLENDSSYDVNIVLSMIDEENNASANLEEDLIQVGEEFYYINIDDGNILIDDSSKNNIICINEEYMLKKSAAFNKLYNMWNKKHDGYSNVDYYVTDNKLFLGFYAEYYIGNHTPMYIYEYDIKSDSVKYVGYIDSTGFGNFSIVK
ncbi:MAG: hypothetical protein E7350_02995 [Clostridiales bacterium]|nr:hypothetical protein [Clostridiales bacterium]